MLYSQLITAGLRQSSTSEGVCLGHFIILVLVFCVCHCTVFSLTLSYNKLSVINSLFLMFLLIEPFSWEDYLRETSSTAASPTCFKQVADR